VTDAPAKGSGVDADAARRATPPERAPGTAVCERADSTAVCERAAGTAVCERAAGTAVCERAAGTAVCERAAGTAAIVGAGFADGEPTGGAPAITATGVTIRARSAQSRDPLETQACMRAAALRAMI